MAQDMKVETIVESPASLLHNIHDHHLPVNSLLHWLGYANNNHKLVVNLGGASLVLLQVCTWIALS